MSSLPLPRKYLLSIPNISIGELLPSCYWNYYWKKSNLLKRNIVWILVDNCVKWFPGNGQSSPLWWVIYWYASNVSAEFFFLRRNKLNFYCMRKNKRFPSLQRFLQFISLPLLPSSSETLLEGLGTVSTYPIPSILQLIISLIPSNSMQLYHIYSQRLSD